MPKRKRAPDEPGAQSQRFLAAAELLGVDQRRFDRAFKKVVKPRTSRERKK
jgi:hypothetical protein